MDVLSWNKTPQRLVFLNVPCQFTIDDIHQLPISIFVCHSHTLPCNIHSDVCTSLYVWRHLQFNTDNRLTDTSVADIFLATVTVQQCQPSVNMKFDNQSSIGCHLMNTKAVSNHKLEQKKVRPDFYSVLVVNYFPISVLCSFLRFFPFCYR